MPLIAATAVAGCLFPEDHDLTVVGVNAIATVSTELSAPLSPIEAVGYRWEISDAPIPDAGAPPGPGPIGRFTPPLRGTYVIDRWAVLGLAEELTHRFEVIAAPLSPVAVATPERSPVRVGDFIRLDASMSYSPEGLPLTYRWELVTSSTNVPGLPATGPRFEFQALVAGSYTFRLIVRDDRLFAQITVSVFASP